MSATAAPPAVTQPQDWLPELDRFHGEWQGAASGANICVIVNRIEAIGGGPRLHNIPMPKPS